MLRPGSSRSAPQRSLEAGDQQARGRRRSKSLGLALIVAVVLGPLLGMVIATAQPSPDATEISPATGGAQVIAQGIAPVDDGAHVWRAALYTAQPRGTTPPVSRPLGWVVASEAPILLTNENPFTGVLEYDSRLAPGEAAFVRPDTVQERASLDATPVTYVAMELVPALTAGHIDDGTLLFMSPAFSLSAGDRDLDCVSSVLRPGDTTVIPDVGIPVAIFATDGAIDVIPSGERARTLQVGQSGIFTGDIEIRGSTGTLGTGGLRAFAAQGEPGLPGGSFVAAVIGPEIPPPPAPNTESMPTAPPTDETTNSMPGTAPTPTEEMPAPAPTEARPTETPRQPVPTENDELPRPTTTAPTPTETLTLRAPTLPPAEVFQPQPTATQAPIP